MNMENPMPLVIFQLKIKMDIKTNINIIKRMAIEQTIPLAETVIGVWKTMVYINHGKGNLKMKLKRKILVV